MSSWTLLLRQLTILRSENLDPARAGTSIALVAMVRVPPTIPSRYSNTSKRQRNLYVLELSGENNLFAGEVIDVLPRLLPVRGNVWLLMLCHLKTGPFAGRVFRRSFLLAGQGGLA